mgnify:CR=1 FL=1
MKRNLLEIVDTIYKERYADPKDKELEWILRSMVGNIAKRAIELSAEELPDPPVVTRAPEPPDDDPWTIGCACGAWRSKDCNCGGVRDPRG